MAVISRAGRPAPGESVRPVAVLAALKRRLDGLRPSLAADLTTLAGAGARGGRQRLRQVSGKLTNVKERAPRPV